jgi:predicted Abi (CAAX) family protease
MEQIALIASWRRLRRAILVWPSPSDWLFAALIGLATLIAMASIGFAGGLYRLGTPNYEGFPLRLISVAVIPSLSEECVFRGLLMPDRSETTHPLAAIIGTTVIFTIWHIVETLFLRHAAPTFLRPDFLGCAATLGAGAAVIRWRSGSLWPCVGLHWLVVVCWQTWLGGPTMATLS